MLKELQEKTARLEKEQRETTARLENDLKAQKRENFDAFSKMKKENADRDDGVRAIAFVLQKVSVLLAETETRRSIVHLLLFLFVLQKLTCGFRTSVFPSCLQHAPLWMSLREDLLLSSLKDTR